MDNLANARTSEDRRARLIQWMDSPESTRGIDSTENLASIVMDLKSIARYLIAENEELHNRITFRAGMLEGHMANRRAHNSDPFG